MLRSRLTSLGVTLVLLATIGVQGVAVTARATSALPQDSAATSFTDLGTLDSLGGSGPIAVSDADTVAFSTGVWRAGAFAPTPHVPGSTTLAPADINAMNAAGLVVGAAGYADGYGGHGFYWNTTGAAGPSFYPAFPDLDINPTGCVHGNDDLYSVDAAGEAAGVGGYHLAYCQVASVAITVASTASADTQVPPLHDIWAIEPGWAIGHETGVTGAVLYNRGDGASTTITNLAQLGLLNAAGATLVRTSPSQISYRAAGGALTPVTVPAGTVQVGVGQLTDTGAMVGQFDAGSGQRAALWTSPTATPEDLNDRPGIPAGWTLTAAYATNAAGDIAGVASDGAGSQHAYLLSGRRSAVSVAMTLTLPPGGLGVGDSLAVPVTVTDSGGTDLTGLALAFSAGAPQVKVTKTPAGTTGFALTAGASTTFVYQLTATQAGAAPLSVTVTGPGPVSATDSKTLSVAARPLVISIVTTPHEIALEVDEKGKLKPKTVTVRVRLTNKTKGKITGISLQSVRPVPADPTQALDQLAVPKGALPVKLADLAPGKSVVKDYPVKVTGDGSYLVRALALYADHTQPGGNGRATGQGGAFTVAAPLLWFRASQRLLDRGVDGGSPWYVTGEVRNLSSYQTLCLPPLLPTFTGNAAGLGPRQISLAEPAPPLAGALKPGAYLLFIQRVDTSADGSTRGSVEFDPTATLGVSGDTCNVLETAKKPRIAAAKVVLAKDSRSFFTHVDNSSPGPADAGSLEFFGEFAKGSAAAVAKAYEGTLVLAHEYGSVTAMENGLRNISPANLAARCEAALASMDKALALTAEFWINTTAAEKQAFLAQVVSDVVAKSGQVWTGVAAAIQQSATTWFDSVVNAYYSGDTTTMFRTLGKAAPGALGEVAVETAKWEIGFALLKKGAQLTGISRRVTQASKLISKLADMPAGRILNFEEMGRLWGLAKEDVLAFDKIATEEGVVIGVRGRAPISVERLEEGAVWKHENLKPKNVNVIDSQYLGFPSSDEGLVAFRSYTQQEKTAIIKRIQSSNLTAEQKQVVFSRATTRFNESSKYLKKIEGFAAEGKIDVGFNYRENGLDLDTTSEVRDFALDKEPVTGGTYYRPLQENPALDGLAESGALPKECVRRLAAVLCRVTGDMDGVYVTNPGGSSLDPTKLARVYEKLAAAGWQHPETLTWVNNEGSFYFSAKAKILKGLEKGGEAMVEFGPDGIARSTYLDLSKSFLFAPQSFYLDVDGGYSTLR